MRNLESRFARYATRTLTWAVFTLCLLGITDGRFVIAEPNGPGGKRYEVTVTNLTRGQSFTPILVASHKAGLKFFASGDPASEPLEILAEGGNTMPLEAWLLSFAGQVQDVETSSGLLGPGETTTIVVEGGGQFDHLSVASMLIPTNDGFFALNGIAGPKGNDTDTHYSPVYDSGSEPNDELCANIPGPVCGGEGDNLSRVGAEGFVHVHAGIHGIGDLIAADRDWRNPAARISIRRID